MDRTGSNLAASADCTIRLRAELSLEEDIVTVHTGTSKMRKSSYSNLEFGDWSSWLRNQTHGYDQPGKQSAIPGSDR